MSSASTSKTHWVQHITSRQDLLLPAALVGSLFVILAPLPTALMDVLLAANITLSVVMLLTTVYVRTPMEFAVFPTLLLTSTLVRLVLNVATTRLILTQGAQQGDWAAGGVVKGFGEFVAGDHLMVGLVIFAIIVVIQFVVITKGSTRISEVAARFMLDGLPGRQMAIDADVNAGLIDQLEAQRRRQEVARQADFFSAMDGASKFVRGDAVAGMLITGINLLGGLFIGCVESGMSLGEAVGVFSKLTIGDGLVSQVPAFLISLAAGILVTRSTAPTNLPREFCQQLLTRPQALAVSAVFLAALMLTGLPAAPLGLLAAGCAVLAYFTHKSQREAEQEAQAAAKEQTTPAKPTETKIEELLAVDPLELEIGIGLICMADAKRGSDLLERIQRVRHTTAAEIGVILPKVRVRDNMRLRHDHYAVKISDHVVAEGALRPSMLLAVDLGAVEGRLEGTNTIDPVSLRPAVWIDPGKREAAQRMGYRVIEPSVILAAHLTEVIRRHADELLSRDAVKHLVDQLHKTSPAVVDELIPHRMKLGEVQQVLQRLLRERVPVRNLALILETLADHAGHTQDIELLTELVRQRLGRALSSRLRDGQKRLFALTLEPSLERRLIEHLSPALNGEHKRSSLDLEELCRQVEHAVQRLTSQGRPPTAVVDPRIRAAFRRLTENVLPQMNVLSFREISPDTRVESCCCVCDPAGAPPTSAAA